MKTQLSDNDISKHYLAIIQSETDAIITSDHSKKILSWNKGAERIFGYSESEVIGKFISILMPKRFREMHDNGILRMIHGEKPKVIGKTVELVALHKNGHEFPVELTLAFWASDDEFHFSGIIRDISKRIELENIINEQRESLEKEKQDLEEQVKRYYTISQSEQDAIITSDESKLITSWNKGAEKMFGYSSQEVIGNPVSVIIPGKFRQAHNEGMDRIISGGNSEVIGQTVELIALHKNGAEFPIELTLGSWASLDKKYFSGIIRNISERKKAEKQINDEKNKSEALLQNILPVNIIKELKAKGKVQPRLFSEASIIFADIAGFTKITEDFDVSILVDELNSMFSKFDRIIKKQGMEKIKTIGDAYMCAGGIPNPNNVHAIDCILAAIKFQSYVHSKKKEWQKNKREYWKLRIGVHTGPVIAGVVGEWKYTYDIWGDSVNIAARLEQSGLPGKINISQTTYEKVKDFFVCSHRGQIEVKNKGKMNMYLITGIQKELSVDNEGKRPNEKFFALYEKYKARK